MERENLTRQHAFERVLDASTGSLVGATYVYLLELRLRLLAWVDRIDNELHRMDMLVTSDDGED